MQHKVEAVRLLVAREIPLQWAAIGPPTGLLVQHNDLRHWLSVVLYDLKFSFPPFLSFLYQL